MRSSRTASLTILTPEGVEFALPLAGPMVRFFAWLIDFATIAVLTMLCGTVSAFASLISPDFGQAFAILFYFGITIGYGIALETLWGGRTLGKWIMKLRVVDERGLKLRFSQIAIRNFLRFLDALPATYLVGGIAMALNAKAQRLGDVAAGTVVVTTRPATLPSIDQIAKPKYNSFTTYPHLEARLRQRLTPEEAAVAVSALLRRDQFDPIARVQLFKDIADHLRAQVAFPEEATLGITDEQYVRNAVDSLYRS